jgi:hypothetical protein
MILNGGHPFQMGIKYWRRVFQIVTEVPLYYNNE